MAHSTRPETRSAHIYFACPLNRNRGVLVVSDKLAVQGRLQISTENIHVCITLVLEGEPDLSAVDRDRTPEKKRLK